MEVLDILIEILSDGDWHSINEISIHKSLSSLSISQIQTLLNFLAEYDFIEVNQRPAYDLTVLIVEAKLTESMLEFLRKIRWIEKLEWARV